MSGVLFVVYIPSKAEEKKLRKRYESDEVHLEKEKALSTPEMQRHGKDASGDDSDSEAEGSIKRDCHLAPPTTPLIRSKSSDQLSTMGLGDNLIKKSIEGLKEMLTPRIQQVQIADSKDIEYLNDLALAPDAYMEDIMTAIMKKKKLRRVTWLPTRNNEGHQILFNIENGSRCDDTIRLLGEWGVGEREGTSVSVLPCTLYYEPIHEQQQESPDDNAKEEKQSDPKDSPWSKFVNSVRARLNVAEIVHQVRADATITFDFVILVFVAAFLAAFGLVEDNPLFLAASMLISPLMGPIIAAIFGSAIKDGSLQRLGVFNELYGLLMTTFVGFLFGIIICSIDDKYGIGEGLTNEMLSRCEIHSVFVGICIAIVSGAAVAIAILGDNTGSLVGTAISASLLPPAVNAGLMWALSCIYLLFEKDGARYNSVIKTNYYSDHQAVELAIFGCISMCITITNIISIYLVGVIFLKIKEVVPVHSHRHFWHHDVKIARDYNKTVLRHDPATDELVAELASLKMHERVEGMHGIGAELFKPQNTWSPMNQCHHHADKPHVRDLESLYLTLAVNSNPTKMFPRQYSVKSPPIYKSVPDENFLSPNSRRTQAVDTPRRGSKPASNSVPTEFVRSNSKRFVVTPSSDDPLKKDKA